MKTLNAITRAIYSIFQNGKYCVDICPIEFKHAVNS